jgi:hypothetical protein
MEFCTLRLGNTVGDASKHPYFTRTELLDLDATWEDQPFERWCDILGQMLTEAQSLLPKIVALSLGQEKYNAELLSPTDSSIMLQ